MKRMVSLLSLVAGAAGLVLGAQPASAATFTVDTTVDDPALTACTAAANDCSLRGAVIAANAAAGPDTIRVPAGTYVLSVVDPFVADDDFSLSDDLDIASNITLLGLGGGATIDASGLVNGGRAIHIVTGSLNSTLRNVKLTGGTSVPGAGVYINPGTGLLTIRDSRVTSNDAMSNTGGGIWNGATLVVRNSTIENNNSGNGDGGGIYSDAGATLTVTGSTITGNSAAIEGGGIYNAGTAATLQSSVVTANTAGWSGGGVSNRTSLTVTASAITGNAANGALGYPQGGGGVFSYSTTGLDSVSISNSLVADNDAPSGWGGGVMGFTGILSITGTDILRNSALNGGGVVAGGVTTVTGGRINQNSATDDGGGLWVAGGYVGLPKSFALDGTTVARNAASDGAGFWVEASQTTFSVRNATISANAAPGFGGGAYILDNDAAATAISFTASVISENTADSGAGLYIYGAPDVKLKNVTVDANVAASQGGGLRLTDSTTVITNSTISNNTATAGDGGGVYTEDDGELSRTSINNSTISGNSASGVGGGIYNEFSGALGAATYLFSVTVANNGAAGGGSGIANNAGFVTMRNTIVGQAAAGANCVALAGGVTNAIGQNLEDAATCGAAIVAAPLLNALALNAPGTTATHSLQAASPAINAGPAAGCAGDGNGDGVPDMVLATDQRGVARAGLCDLGAYEF